MTNATTPQPRQPKDMENITADIERAWTAPEDYDYQADYRDATLPCIEFCDCHACAPEV